MPSPSRAAVTASVQRQVTCESCGHHYEYKMSRIGTGSYSGFAWNDEEARAKAMPEAFADLDRQLATDCDVVPCPKCGQITSAMREKERNDIGTSLLWAVLGAVVALVAYLILSTYWEELSESHSRRRLVFAGLVGVLGAGACLFRTAKLLAILSNRQQRKNWPAPSSDRSREAATDRAPAPSLGVAAVTKAGDGSSPDSAVLLDPDHNLDPDLRHFAGISMEYEWIKRHYPGAQLLGQRMDQAPGRIFDVLSLSLPSGEHKAIWFDITSFFPSVTRAAEQDTGTADRVPSEAK
jgi:hypothetical protein